MKEFVIGDIHGAYKALRQCLERSNFDYTKDKLIVLGDIVDGWPETPKCIEELLKIPNYLIIMGNHDKWADDWFRLGIAPSIWTSQGGQATIDAYFSEPKLLEKHKTFFAKAHYYYVDDQNRLFLHGGFYPYLPIQEQSPEVLMWDRSIAFKTLLEEGIIIPEYKEVYLGHTTTWKFSKTPVHKGNVWLLDQGGGFEGKLSIMDINSKEFWQSDVVAGLYPNFPGRK